MIKVLKDLFKDALTYGFANVIGQVISFFLLPIYTRYLSPTDYGILAMLSFVGLFFVPLASMGITNAVFRRFNLHKDMKLQLSVLSTGSIFILGSSLLLLIIGYILGPYITLLLVNSTEYTYLFNISIIIGFCSSMAAIFTVTLRAQRKVRVIAVIKIIQLLVSITISITLVVVFNMGIKGVLLGNLTGTTVSLVLLFFSSRKLLSLNFDLNELKALLNYGLPYLPHRLLGISTLFLGQYFMKTFIGLAETGLFNIALKFTLPLSFIVNAVQTAWVPIKFQIHREEEKASLVFRQLITFYVIVLAILFIGYVMISPELIRIMTPEEYLYSAFLFPFVLLIPFTQAIQYMAGTGFEYTNDTRPAPLVSGSALIMLIGVVYLTVGYLGIIGIILANIMANLTSATLIRYFATKRFFVPINFKTTAFCIINVFIAAFCVYLFQNMEQGIRILLQAIFWVINLGLLSLLLIRSKDLEQLQRLDYIPVKRLNNFYIKIKARFK